MKALLLTFMLPLIAAAQDLPAEQDDYMASIIDACNAGEPNACEAMLDIANAAQSLNLTE